MLCDKDFNVLIVQNTCPQSGCTADAVIKNSWGFRQQTASPKRYIATSAMLWQNGSIPTFSAYENVRLPAVLQRADANAKNWPNPPNFPAASTSPDMPVMTLLAVLAQGTCCGTMPSFLRPEDRSAHRTSVPVIFISPDHGVASIFRMSMIGRVDGSILLKIFPAKRTIPIICE